MAYVFLGIILLFVAAVIFRGYSKTAVCSICLSVAGVWIGLLVLSKTGYFNDQVLLGLLLGQSIAGGYYLLRSRVPAILRVFTLPYFLTLAAAAYWLITGRVVLPAFFLTALTWLAAWLIFTYRDDPGKKMLTDTVMNCCQKENE